MSQRESAERPRAGRSEPAASQPVSREDIVAAALRLGEVCGWEALTLRAVAQELNVSLAVIYAEFPQKDDLVDAWFEQADRALLSKVPGARWQRLGSAERVEQAIWCWLTALAPHRRLTRNMLWYKLEPGHIHLQLAGIMRISRTVQWLREAADLHASHLHRVGQEIALSSVFVTVFVYWLWDSSPEQQKTRQLLVRQLAAGVPVRLWQ